jgi:hypothetical protein
MATVLSFISPVNLRRVARQQQRRASRIRSVRRLQLGLRQNQRRGLFPSTAVAVSSAGFHCINQQSVSVLPHHRGPATVAKVRCRQCVRARRSSGCPDRELNPGAWAFETMHGVRRQRCLLPPLDAVTASVTISRRVIGFFYNLYEN